jgi:hypothetical protein
MGNVNDYLTESPDRITMASNGFGQNGAKTLRHPAKIGTSVQGDGRAEGKGKKSVK